MRQGSIQCFFVIGVSLCFVSSQICGTILSENDHSIVTSGEMEYDGKEIVLVGKVSMQHSLGEIQASRVTFQSVSGEASKKCKFGSLCMTDDVQITLLDGGQLQCQKAEVNYANMQGVFWGNQLSPDVIYLNIAVQEEGKSNTKPHLVVKSEEMCLKLSCEPNTTKTLVQEIEANRNIRVYYNQNYLLVADKAHYQRLAVVDSPLSEGLLQLSTENNLSECRLTNQNGDSLLAEKIEVDTIHRKLWFDKPFGTLHMGADKGTSQVLECKANELFWNDLQQTLQLHGQVTITQNGTLQIEADPDLFIQQSKDKKKSLRLMEASKNVKISYVEATRGCVHTIHCPGPFSINNELLQMILRSNESTQVYIEDVLGEMYADHVCVTYHWDDQKFVQDKIVLKGNVRLINRFDGHLEESGSILHYALADTMEYVPDAQQITLIGTKENRVLFFDKVNNIQMSAPSLKIMHDKKTHKDSVQGMGDVRFTFVEKEFKQLKEHFQLESSEENEGATTK